MADWVLLPTFVFHHLLMFAIFAALVLYPVGRVLGRMGFSPLWCIFALIPPFNLILLWMVAFIDWPARTEPSAQ